MRVALESEWSHDSGPVWYDLGRCFHLEDGRLVKVVGVEEAVAPFDQKLIVTPEGATSDPRLSELWAEP